MSSTHQKIRHQDSNDIHSKDQEFEQNYQNNNSAENDYDQQEQAVAAAEGGSIENFLDNSLDYDNENNAADDDEGENEEANLNDLEEQTQNINGLNGNAGQQSEQQMEDFEEEEEEEGPEEEFHSFTLERDVDPDELKDPNNYYEQLSLSFYNTHKKGDQITRKMIEQSLQQYLEAKRITNFSSSQSGRQDSRLQSRGCNQDETTKKNFNVRVKVINSNVEQLKPKKNVFAAQIYNNGVDFEFDKNTTKDATLLKLQNNEKLIEQNRALHHNQFQVTNSIKSHRYFVKENIEGEQSNQQKQINFAQLMIPNQPLGFQINQNSEYTKYTPNHKVIDMDSGFKGSIRQKRTNYNNQKEDEKLTVSQNHIYHKVPNKGVNLLNHVQCKVNSKDIAAPHFNTHENIQNDYINVNRIQTESNTPRDFNAFLFSRKHSGEDIKSFNRYNVGSKNNINIQKHKEVFPAIKLEDDHIRYINTNENLQVQGKNQIKLVKQNDFFEFAAQLYNTNKSGNPQQIPNQMIKKLNLNKQAFSSNQLQRISNQLQNKLKNDQNSKQIASYLSFKKEPISITSR
ncbi:hypothetical protein ABPG74_019570 [Tetrahymena malaccensis]